MLIFTDDCLIGVDQIDEEHRGLFQLVGEIHDLLKNEYMIDKHDQIRDKLERLETYADEHFRHEEEYMEQINHPELELQKKQHLEFDEKMSELDAIMEGQDQEKVLEDLLVYLLRWLYRHIIGSDLMIGKMVTLEEWKKNSYTFTKQYLTGIELIDEEHKELFRIINEVHDVIANDLLSDKYDEIVRLLDSLRTYTKVHFKDEEDYMERIQYKGLEAQKVAHETFINRLDMIDLNEIDSRQQDALEEIMAFLTEWLINHILHMDKKISEAN